MQTELTHPTLVFDGREVTVGVVPLSRTSGSFMLEWEDLESRAVEGNAYLSPHFVLPASRFLDPRKRLVLLVVRCRDRGQQGLLGLGVFIARPPKRKFPLPHLEAYQSEHTFRTGMLVDSVDCDLVLNAVGEYLSSAKVSWCGLEFVDRAGNSMIDRLAQRKEAHRVVRWCEYHEYDRAILRPSTSATLYEELLAKGKFGKDMRRKQRRIAELGTVEWRFLGAGKVGAAAVETFLNLEHKGWKSGSGTSLLANPDHADFFRDMVARFAAAGRAFFAELLVDGRVIASTCNFTSGKTAYAFKIGWDPEFASLSPGILNELELMRHASEFLPGIDIIDSGSKAGSYIDRLWTERQKMTSGVLTGGYAGAAVRPAILLAQRLNRRINKFLHKPAAS